MRAFLVPAALLALGVAACGAITGLGEYSAGSPDGSAGGTGDDDAMTHAGQESGSGDDLGSDDASDALGPTDDGPITSDDGSGDDGGEPVDGSGETADGTSTGADGGGVHDAASEAAPVCSASNCGGCCSGGSCVGGLSTGTCGSGGVACKSCSGSTPVCSSGGTCVAEPMEASAPTCTMSSCAATICIPVYQRGCCKSDGTCGCQVDIPSIGSCN